MPERRGRLAPPDLVEGLGHAMQYGLRIECGEAFGWTIVPTPQRGGWVAIATG